MLIKVILSLKSRTYYVIYQVMIKNWLISDRPDVVLYYLE